MNLNQVTVGTTNLERSIAFYRKLGLELIVHSTDHYARFICPEGESTFSLHVVDEVQSASTSIYFETKELDNTVNELIEKYKLVFDLLPTNQSWLWREARLKDPDGNHIILYYAGDNRKNPPWRIK